MKRRGFLLASALAPFAVRAQEAKPRRVKLLTGGRGVAALTDALRAGLRQQGWVEGSKLQFELVAGVAGEAAAAILQREIASRPDVMVVAGGPLLGAVRRLTDRLPIVGVDLESDPVAAGFIQSLARPGGNMTGIWLDMPELAGKQVQFVRDMSPGTSAIGVLWDEDVGAPQLAALQTAARSNKVAVFTAPVVPETDTAATIAGFARQGAKAVIVLNSPRITIKRAPICDAALRHRLAVFGVVSLMPEAGALLAYGPNLAGLFHQAAGHVSKILDGSRPGDIPAERPAKFELVLNMKTAKALGIKVPQAILQRVDRVIE